MGPVLALTAGFGILGLLVGRWPIVLVPAATWITIDVGLARGWWGHGLGDSWQVITPGFILMGVAAASAGIAINRLVRRGVSAMRS